MTVLLLSIINIIVVLTYHYFGTHVNLYYVISTGKQLFQVRYLQFTCLSLCTINKKERKKKSKNRREWITITYMFTSFRPVSGLPWMCDNCVRHLSRPLQRGGDGWQFGWMWRWIPLRQVQNRPKTSWFWIHQWVGER